ncbi:exosome complex protein Rrp42 [Candidatus Micrarchaeota archaeon]|nr:exosome complex protein Rrp42 [Candidatus Micrarchaeota archaeon]
MEINEEILWSVKRDAIRALIEAGKRSDNREWNQFRAIELAPDFVRKAEGSCFIKLGNTQVLVGVKFAVGVPYPDTPESGTLMTSAELVPIASPIFRAGPPDEDSIELARVVDRGIRESKMIDFDALCITPKEEVWSVMVDLHVLDHDGNLLDAASIAAVRALLDARFPKYEDKKVIYTEKTKKKLPLKDVPVSSTFAKVGSALLLDPLLEEEKAMDARVTIATTHEGNICAIQKGGSGSFTLEECEKLASEAIKAGKEIRKQHLK